MLNLAGTNARKSDMFFFLFLLFQNFIAQIKSYVLYTNNYHNNMHLIIKYSMRKKNPGIFGFRKN